MRKQTWIFTLVLMVATAVLTTALLAGCKKKPEETKPSLHIEITTTEQTSGEATVQTTDSTGNTASTEATATDGESDQTTASTETETDTQGSVGVDEDWDDETEPSTNPTESTEPPTTQTVPETTEEETTAEQSTDPTQGDKELTDLTYTQYISLSAQEQEAYYKAFESDDAFLAWYKEAYAAYLENRETVTGDGKIDINDYIGN